MEGDEVGPTQRVLEGDDLDRLLPAREPLAVPEVHQPLHRGDEAREGGRARGAVAEHVHVEADRLPRHALADPAHPEDGQRPSRHLVPEPRQVRVPRGPLARAHLLLGRVELARDGAHHEEGVLGGGIGQDVGGVGVGNPVPVRGRAVDVVHPDRDLGDHAEPRGRPRRKDLLVDRVPEGRDEGGDPGADLVEDERLRGRLDLVVDLDLPPALAEAVQGVFPDVAGDVDPEGAGPRESVGRPEGVGQSFPRGGVPRITLPA